MIKFFKGDYTDVASQINGANNIVFVTDRNVLYMGGAEYGKDQFKSVTTSAEILSDGAAAGTIFYVSGEQALYEKTATSAEVILPSVSGQVNDLKNAISATISSAFGAGSGVVISKAGGIEKTDFVLDTTSGVFDASNAPSTTLVNAATLKNAIDQVNTSKATITDGNGIDVTSSQTEDGITWTISTTIDTTASSLLAYDADGKITTDIKIKKLTTAQDNYAASYQLITKRGDTETVLGDTINIAKARLLKEAKYVYGTEDNEGHVSEITDGSQTAASNRYLKLVFYTDANGNGTQDSGETDEVVYINVNELFDSYTGVSGVAVNQTTNEISAVIDPTSEAFLTVGATGIKLSGVEAAIDADIQALGQVAATAGEYVTAIGVTAAGALSTTTAQVSAAQVAFNNTNTTSLTAATVQAAIDELAADVAGGFGSLSAAQVGSSTQYITSISQTSGIITATAEDLTADKVAFGTDSNVSAALTGLDADIDAVSAYINTLDLTDAGAGTAPTSGNTGAYSIVNTVSQADGKVSETKIDLTAANTYQAGDTAVATGASTEVSIGVTQGTVQNAIEDLANAIADFGSFHDGTGAVI